MNSYFKIVRPLNLLIVLLTQVLMHAAVIRPILAINQLESCTPVWALILVMLSTLLITMAGYIINDYFDTRIDEINRPQRVIIGRKISRHNAMKLHQVLTIIGVLGGLLVSWNAHSMPIALIFVAIPGLLWFYSSSYKRQFLIGNVVVSIITALVPMLIALLEASYLIANHGELLIEYGVIADLYKWVGFFAIFAFMISMLREITKDIEDEQGDREMECNTLPIVWGVNSAKVILVILSLSLVATLMYMIYGIALFSDISLLNNYMIYGICAPLLFFCTLIFKAKRPSDYKIPQQILKIIMLLGVLFSIVFAYSI